MKIRPLIKHDLDYLFVGINPVKKSIVNGKYEYFKSNSTFYSLLHKAGITKEKLNHYTLLDNNIGIVNYYSNYFGKYNEVSEKDKEKAKRSLKRYLLKYKPKKIIFLSFKTAQDFTYCKRKYGKLGWYYYSDFYIVPFPTMPMKLKDKIKYYKRIK